MASLQLTLFVVAIFSTVVLHELGHALTARRYGCVTKDIILLPIGGVARMDRLPEAPLQEVKVALAGPAVNLAIALITYVLFFRLSPVPGLSEINPSGPVNWPAQFLYTNLVLAVFNLLPAFPMDGGRVLRGLLSLRMDRLKATRIAARLGQLIALLMAVTGLFLNPMLVFIGAFIFFGAQVEADFMIGRSFLQGATVRDVVMRPLVTLQSNQTLGDAMQALLESPATRFVVMDGTVPVGTIDRKMILKQVEESGKDKNIAACMRRDIPVSDSGDGLEALYNRMQSGNDQLVLVKEGEAISGYVDLENVLEFILLRQALSKRNKFELFP